VVPDWEIAISQKLAAMSPKILCADDQVPADDILDMEIANTVCAAHRECGVDFQRVVNRFCT
jgi:hypothetical protein